MTKEELKAEYDSKSDNYQKLCDEIKYTLDDLLKKHKIKRHSIPSRVKDFDSFYMKTERKHSKKPFKEITDLAGIRIVCLLYSDIERISQLIRDNFNVISEENKIKDGNAESFGYLSSHFVVTFKKDYKGPRYDSIKDIPAEIQVRTLAMDAWASVSHYLDYKQEVDIPKELRKDFYALSGLFYVADTHFEMLFKSREENLSRMKESFRKKDADTDQEVNFDTITTYLNNKFPDREITGPNDMSNLISELTRAGYHTIGKIDLAVNKGFKAFAKFERDHPPGKEIDGEIVYTHYSISGTVRVILKIVDPSFRITWEIEKNKNNDSEYEPYRKLLE